MTSATQPYAHAAPSDTLPGPLRLSLAMLLLMLVLGALDQTIVATALPAIAHDLGETARLTWIFSAYLIAATVAVPLYGKLADLHGTRPVLLVAVALFLAGSLLCGISPGLNTLLLSRGLQGAGGGGLLTLAMTAVVRHFPPASRARLAGLLGGVYGLATMAGPLVGGFIVQHLSWRWAFFVNLPAGLLALVVLGLKFPRPAEARQGAMDYPGAVLLGGALVGLLLGTRPAEAAALIGPAPWFLGLGVVLAVAFVVVQARTAQPLLPLALFKRPGFAAAVLLSMSSGLALFAVVVFLPQYFQGVRGLSPAASGWHLMPLMAGITLGSTGSGRWLSRTGQVRAVAIGACGLAAVDFALLGSVLRAGAPPLALVSALLLPLGAGIGAVFPLVTVVAQRAAPPPLLGIATASPVMFRSIAGAVGVSLLAALFAQSLAALLWTAGGICALAAWVARWMPAVLARQAVSAPDPRPHPGSSPARRG